MEHNFISADVSPSGHLDILSRSEVTNLLDGSQGSLYRTFRNCSLAVLNTGTQMDDGKALLERYASFDICVVPTEHGIKLAVRNAPGTAFVDGKIIKGINEHLFAVLRDIVFVSNEVIDNPRFDLASSQDITDAVFHILRNAAVFDRCDMPNLVVCWGGHSISREEYDYSKAVGYALGLRGMDICTGCGPGAMKGPMKGAAIGHVKQRLSTGQYLGVTEPGIIAAEPPNPLVNDLVIMPDIEKRLEAFVRTGHGIVVFPGGAGTMEEILYLLGILLHPDNAEIPFPLVFTGPENSREYFSQIHQFIGDTLGSQAQQCYKIIIDDAEAVARELKSGLQEVGKFRREKGDAYYFNWRLKINPEFQAPFFPTQNSMRNLRLDKGQAVHMLAANLRRAFSGIVAGNVKDQGIREVEKNGYFEIHGDASIMRSMDALLGSFVEQHRMKLPFGDYIPCYQIVTS